MAIAKPFLTQREGFFMKVLVLRYGLGTQRAKVVAETDTHYEVQRILKSGEPYKWHTTISKKDLRILKIFTIEAELPSRDP